MSLLIVGASGGASHGTPCPPHGRYRTMPVTTTYTTATGRTVTLSGNATSNRALLGV